MNTKNLNLAERKGMAFAVLSGLLYGLLGYFGVSLTRLGFSAFNISFWRFFSAFLMLAIVFLSRREKPLINKREALIAMINGGFFYALPGTLFFISSKYIGTGQAMVIFFIFPVFVMLLNWFFLKVPIKPLFLLSFAFILCGLSLLVDFSELRFDIIGIGLSLIAGFSYALYIFFSAKSSRLSPLCSSLFVAIGCSLTSGTLAIVDGSFFLPHTISHWAFVLGLGIICTAWPILFMFEALKLIDSDRASLLSVLEPVFVVIFGVVLLGEVLSLKAIVGIFLTLAGAMSVSVNFKPLLKLRPNLFTRAN